MNITAFIVLAHVCISTGTILQNGNVTLDFNITDNGIILNLLENDIIKISGHIGLGIQLQFVRNQTPFTSVIGEDVQFAITHVTNGFNIFWESPNITKSFQDCFDFLDFNWFAGRESSPEEWPIQNSRVSEAANIVSSSSPITEPYWLNSEGGYIFVNETTPLFVDQNNLVDGNLCLLAKIKEPYSSARTKLVLNYTIAAYENAKEAHRSAIDNYLGRPTDQPDMKMIREPIWSTWAKYQNDINDQLLLDFAQSIHDHDFRGQVQIEDGWEECRGSLTFQKLQFAAINSTLMSVSGMALRSTVWIHPFVDIACTDIVQIGQSNKYFVKDADGNDIIINSWEGGNSSYLIDFTNEDAKNWFQQRVGILLEKHWLDGFKFEAGEASWATSSSAIFTEDQDRDPNTLTTNYISITNFTHFVHVHSGWRTQWIPVFVSIPEKEPNWSQENGLKSVIINLIQLNLAGYTMVLPGLIGGKSLERPSPELYVRWAQAVSLMPAMQFGYLPWEIIGTSFDVLAIIKKSIDLHYWYADGIANIMRKSKNMGLPVNAPIWWLDPTNPEAFKITDQYTLGENILVAPILTEGAVTRDIYLPPGKWRDGNNDSAIYDGSTTLINYPAPIDVLPYFTRETE